MTEIILSGTEETLKPIITLLVGIAQLLEDKDVGQIVGEPLDDQVAGMVHTSRLKLFCYSSKTPPYTNPIGKRLIKAEYQIPDINPRRITWQGVKDVCGGANGFMWGSFLATAKLDNGRWMHAYGATEADAENMLQRMLTLTTANVLSMGNTELKKIGRRAKGEPLYREPTRVYPAFFYIINSKRINKINKRATAQEQTTRQKSTLRGDFLERGTGRIKLYPDRPPKDFGRIMAKALDFSDSDFI
ncbi:hypothetical protein NIES4101_46330 [Calothrix sp. NIES-4101]|nr:hypothetical protein NIES4101_46330 [Calothrix sp. NIES-4101]